MQSLVRRSGETFCSWRAALVCIPCHSSADPIWKAFPPPVLRLLTSLIIVSVGFGLQRCPAVHHHPHSLPCAEGHPKPPYCFEADVQTNRAGRVQEPPSPELSTTQQSAVAAPEEELGLAGLVGAAQCGSCWDSVAFMR